MSDDKNDEFTYGFEGDAPEVLIARAFYGHEVKRVREHAAGLDLHPERLRRVFEVARSEADRSAAILMFALVEDLMLEAIRRYCDLPGKKWKEVSGALGLLATADDRLTFLLLLRWIEPHVYQDLCLMKSIRNWFAHHAEVSGFEDTKIRDWILAMRGNRELVLAAVLPEFGVTPKKLTAREMFLTSSALVIVALLSNLAITPEARASRVAPGHVDESASWDLYPDNLKKLWGIAGQMIYALLKTDGKPSPCKGGARIEVRARAAIPATRKSAAGKGVPGARVKGPTRTAKKWRPTKRSS